MSRTKTKSITMPIFFRTIYNGYNRSNNPKGVIMNLDRVLLMKILHPFQWYSHKKKCEAIYNKTPVPYTTTFK